MNTQTTADQLLATQDTPKTIPAVVFTYQRHEDIAEDITSRYPHAAAVISRGLEIAHTVQMESGKWEASRRELSGHRVATVNGHAVRRAQRGGRNWNSPPAWSTFTCSCESYEHSSGTATITKSAAWNVDTTAPRYHEHKICKHIAAYAIAKQDNIELKAAADEAGEALAAELFRAIPTPSMNSTTITTGQAIYLMENCRQFGGYTNDLEYTIDTSGYGIERKTEVEGGY